MAGKVRHLLQREGRYFARIGVPAALRTIVGKRELLEPLGADRVQALRKLPAAVARMQAVLDTARISVQTARAPSPRAGRLLTIPQMAVAH